MLPPFISRAEVKRRLERIFPPGMRRRQYVTRDSAVLTVFSMIYCGAIEGLDTFIAPRHVYSMTLEQSERTDDQHRLEYCEKPTLEGRGARLYRDNSRESIRDETLRNGLIELGAVIERTGLATTSQKPRYALVRQFYALFDPSLDEEPLALAIKEYQLSSLSPAAMAKVTIIRQRGATDRLSVTLPGGEVRKLRPGPSSLIAKAVIEEFAPRFLAQPQLLWLSESGVSIFVSDDSLAKSIGINIPGGRELPDLILVDVQAEPLLFVFVEIVASDGPIDERRKTALTEMMARAGFREAHLAFVTAYLDRRSPVVNRTLGELAMNSCAWFTSDPELLLAMLDGTESTLKIEDVAKLRR